MPVVEELVALHAGKAQAEEVEVGLGHAQVTASLGAQTVNALVQASTDDAQALRVGLAPIAFEGQGTQVGFDVEAQRETHQFVARGLVDRVQARAQVSDSVGRQ